MEAQVILLPKPGKDQLACSSYTPIALLNQDLKILTKILATRLSKVIYTLVAIDQIGFIPQSTDTNLRRLFIHLQTDHANPGARVVSLDMAKAFDSMDWNYMSAVLRHMGFGDVFRTWISLLYSKPMAAIKLGTSVSPQFAVCRGTHQGCPLSPSLFTLAIETLAIALRKSPYVKALEVGSIHECTTLYADDMLLFLQNPGPSLEAAFEILGEFSRFSGLCMNWEKLSALAIDTGAQALVTRMVPIAWVSV